FRPAVGGRDHSSGPEVALGLEQPTRRQNPSRGNGTGARCLPIWPCSAWGLPCPRRCRRSGALLPHRFTLAVLSEGGLISVALSFASPRPGVTRHAARVEFGLSSPDTRSGAIAWPARSRGYFTTIAVSRRPGAARVLQAEEHDGEAPADAPPLEQEQEHEGAEQDPGEPGHEEHQGAQRHREEVLGEGDGELCEASRRGGRR